MDIIENNAKTNKTGATIFPLARAHIFCLAALQVSLLLWLVAPLWAAVLPLAVFLLLCLVAPFVQSMQFYLPIISHGEKSSQTVAITFDDGPDPSLTPRILQLLAEYHLKAVFFVIGSKVDEYPDLVKMILAQGHEIGNHSHSHDVFLMCRSVKRLRHEVAECQKALSAFNIRAQAFRPPVGVTNPRLWRVLLETGMVCTGFSCRGRDFGNRHIRGLAQRILKQVKAGDIILLHDNAPQNKEHVERLLQELRDLFAGLKQKGLSVRPLSQLIARPVMAPLDNVGSHPAQTYFDSVAHMSMDGLSRIDLLPARQTELKLFNIFKDTIRAEDRVLEVGAGTGRFTFPLASLACEVWAVDVSSHSLELLQGQAQKSNIENIRVLPGDIEDLTLPGSFDLVCSFSAFEYICDLEPIIRKLVDHLKPGGRLYFITAHQSFFRFFTQMGNAMRQGLWLHARKRRQVEAMLHSLEMAEIRVSSHGMKSMINGGLLIEASAKKN